LVLDKTRYVIDVLEVCITPDYKNLVIVGFGKVETILVSNFEKITLKIHHEWIHGIVITQDSKKMLTTGDDTQIIVSSLSPLKKLYGWSFGEVMSNKNLYALTLLPGEKEVAVAGRAGVMKIFSVETGD
jgi:WD40 repeat protein